MDLFILLATQRSGSIWLMTMLDSHPSITCAGEVFKEGRDPMNINHPEMSFRRFKKASLLDLIRDPAPDVYRRYLDWFLDSGPEGSSRGFKLMVSQLDRRPNLDEVLSGSNASVIKLRRKNLLKQLVSREASRRTKRYRSAGPVDPLAGRVELETRTLIARLNSLEAEQRQLEQFLSNRATIQVTYEDLRADTAASLAELQSFLGVEQATLQSGTKKILSDDLSQIIVNYEDVARSIAGTKFEKYLGLG